MLKKFSLLIFCLSLIGCSSTPVMTSGGSDASSTDISELSFGSSNNFRVGVLLPLSGEAGRYGQGLKKATMLAMEDLKNPNLILQYYDTKGTPEGARTAVENALNQKAKLIIGPLKSSSVQAIAPTTTAKGIPVIAFSTSDSVLEANVYTLGLLVDEQVNRIVSYAAHQGRKRLALLLPDNATGIAVAKAAVKTAQQNNVTVTRIAFYQPNTTDFSDILRKMTDYNIRSARMQRMKNALESKVAQGDEASRRALKRASTFDTLGDVDFDMVLIPESGAKLKSAIAMFGYYDVFAPQVKFLGTSIWENTALNNESTIIGSWYPAMSRSHSNYFANKYAYVYGERPQALFSLAYDAVALASALSQSSEQNLTPIITNPDGYVGINGMFRLFENGFNQHSMDIVEVRKGGDTVIDEAPKKFSPADEGSKLQDMTVDRFYKAPLIFGKDNAIAQSLIYGHTLGEENQPNRYLSTDEERESIRKGLEKMNIVIPGN